MERYLCIHGHFYQPPRENPWLETIERQDSAYPYHDWNERIDAECYAPNAAARILDNSGLIDRIVCNYERISFDFGPTLLSWLETAAPVTYHAVLEADIESRRRFAGHGSAMAQAYNHMILPLANRRDKVTQIIWGIRDFEHRFRRMPEGMWLPETAVDLETLDILAEQGIRFTILAPRQAHRVRRIGDREWTDVSGERVDPTRAYQVALPSGRIIAVFFYDGPVSRSIAFEGTLRDGGQLADRLLALYNDGRPHAQLVNVATDGETFGHHHQFGEMALAYALRTIINDRKAHVTNYAEFLERFPPTHEVEIVENSSWSCVHGVERWRSHCGCNTGGQPGWTQEWRAPLRASFDWLRDTLAPHFDRLASELLANPWDARNAYIDVILNRSDDRVAEFFDHHHTHPLSPEETTRALSLLEMQRNAMLMYTSCAWFFNDISGIETIQVLQYAGRVMQLAEAMTGQSLKSRFVSMLEAAKSNIREQRDGRHVYEEYVESSGVDIHSVAAHFGINALFREGGLSGSIGCFEMTDEHTEVHAAGKTRLALGAMNVVSRVTRETARVAFAAVHTGDHNVTCGIQLLQDSQTDAARFQNLLESLRHNDIPAMMRAMDEQFDGSIYTLESLFGDEQRRILRHILSTSLGRAESIYRGIYGEHAPIMRFVTRLHMPPPLAFVTAAEFVINEELRRAFSVDEVDLTKVQDLMTEARRIGVALDETSIGFALGRNLNATMQDLFATPSDLGLLEKASALATLAESLGYRIDLRDAQNACYEMRQWIYPGMVERSQRDDQEARWWVDRFRSLAAALWIRLEPL